MRVRSVSYTHLDVYKRQVTGPRQVGKTTLLRRLAEGNRTYVTMDDINVRLSLIHIFKKNFRLCSVGGGNYTAIANHAADSSIYQTGQQRAGALFTGAHGACLLYTSRCV